MDRTKSPPKVLEPVGRHFGVPDRMLDVPVAEVVLQSPCVVAIVGELEPTGMAKHVGVDRKWHLCSLADALDEAVETGGADGPAAVGNEDGSLFRVLAAQLTQRPHLVAPDGMHAGNAVLDAVNVQARIARSAAIASRRPPRPAGRADRRPGSWLSRDARSGHACVRSPSTARTRVG